MRYHHILVGDIIFVEIVIYMKTMLDPAARAAFITRVNAITSESKAIWGKMTPDQVVHHLNRAMEFTLGDYSIPYTGNFMLSLMKPLIIRLPMQKGKFETFAEMRADGQYDLEAEKKKFAELLDRYKSKESMVPQPKSALLGNMTAQEWGLLDYTHTDHHLKQFGV